MKKSRVLAYSFVLVISSCLFVGCMSPKSLATSVKSVVFDDFKAIKPLNIGNIVLNTDGLQKIDSAVAVERVRSYFIPAIFIWGWENTLKCQINDNYFVNVLVDEINRQNDEFQFGKYLADRHLEITIESVPSVFEYSDRGFYYFAFVAYGYSSYEGIQPDNQKFQVSYRILDGEKELKKSVFTKYYNAPFRDQWLSGAPLANKYVKEVTQAYDEDCGHLVSGILDELY